MRSQKNFRVILIIGLILTFNAGFINSIALMSFYHQAVGYMTGNLVYLTLNLDSRSYHAAIATFVLILFFLIGAIIDGVILNHQPFLLNKNYFFVLVIQSVLLALAILFFSNSDSELTYFGICLASTVCGMQNSMTTAYSGSVIRTTHMTGVLTDLGVQIGHYLRGQRHNVWLIQFFTMTLMTFVAGSFAGVFLYMHYVVDALWLSVLITFCLSLSYLLKSKKAAYRH